MGREICVSDLHEKEIEYNRMLVKAKKMVKQKELPDEFFLLNEKINDHYAIMNIEYSLICQKNPSLDDLKKVKDSEVVINAVYQLHEKCKDRYPSFIFTSLIANNLFSFCD